MRNARRNQADDQGIYQRKISLDSHQQFHVMRKDVCGFSAEIIQRAHIIRYNTRMERGAGRKSAWFCLFGAEWRLELTVLYTAQKSLVLLLGTEFGVCYLVWELCKYTH